MLNELLCTYRFPQTHSKIRRQLQPKADKTIFKVQIKIKFFAHHSSEHKKIFQIFCSSKQNPVTIIGDRASINSIPVYHTCTVPLYSMLHSSSCCMSLEAPHCLVSMQRNRFIMKPKYGFDQQRLIWYVFHLWDMVFS